MLEEDRPGLNMFSRQNLIFKSYIFFWPTFIKKDQHDAVI